MSNLTLPGCSLRLYPLVQSLVAWEKTPIPLGSILLSGSCTEWEGAWDPPFLQTEPPWLPQLLLIRCVLQAFPQLCCPFMDMLQHSHDFPEVSSPELDTSNTQNQGDPGTCKVLPSISSQSRVGRAMAGHASSPGAVREWDGARGSIKRWGWDWRQGFVVVHILLGPRLWAWGTWALSRGPEALWGRAPCALPALPHALMLLREIIPNK